MFGFIGLHRLYLKSRSALAFILIFVAILVVNIQTREAREVARVQIYRSSLPFLFLHATGLAICVIFPDLVLWLPRQVYG